MSARRRRTNKSDVTIDTLKDECPYMATTPSGKAYCTAKIGHTGWHWLALAGTKDALWISIPAKFDMTIPEPNPLVILR